jgi:hypothetical protein
MQLAHEANQLMGAFVTGSSVFELRLDGRVSVPCPPAVFHG